MRDRHDRLHDGLRHDGHRAGPGAGEVQEAGGRRCDQDREQHGAAGADPAGIQAGPDGNDRGAHRQYGHDRRRAGPEAGASAGVRLFVQAGQRHADHSLHGARADDGGGAAVYFGRDFEDDQHAGGVDAGRDHERLHRIVEAGPEGRGDLPRQFEAGAAAELRR